MKPQGQVIEFVEKAASHRCLREYELLGVSEHFFPYRRYLSWEGRVYRFEGTIFCVFEYEVTIPLEALKLIESLIDNSRQRSNNHSATIATVQSQNSSATIV